MAIISCGEIDQNILYPIFGGLSKLSAEFILLIKKPIFTEHPFILGIIAGFGMFLSIIPFIIVKIRLLENNNEKQRKRNKHLIYNDPNRTLKRKFCKKFLLIFCASLLDFTQKFFSFAYAPYIKDNYWLFDIIFISIFSRIILKSKLNSYQKFSLGMIIILGIILIIINYDGFTIITILVEVMHCLEVVITKYLMDDIYCSPYEISIFEGLFEIIVNIILLIISTKKIMIDKDNFYGYIDKLEKLESIYWEIILLIISMLSRLFFKLFGLITIQIYTSSHIILLFIIGESIFFFWDFKEYYILFLNIFLFVLLLFMFLVFTEFIELNFCGLQKDIKRNIQERALTETSLGNQINISDDTINDEEENEEY
jgi:hypothetical protein